MFYPFCNKFEHGNLKNGNRSLVREIKNPIYKNPINKMIKNVLLDAANLELLSESSQNLVPLFLATGKLFQLFRYLESRFIIPRRHKIYSWVDNSKKVLKNSF